MNIVICGAGEVGRHAAEVLAHAGQSITVVDRSAERIDMLGEIDARTMVGNCTQADVLIEAGASNSDLVLATTNVDEINLLCASVAKAVGAKQSMARVHHSAFFEKRGLDYGRHLGIDHLVCPEFTTAQAIAATIRSPGAIAVESFARGKIEMQTFPVSKNAKVVGQMLRELKLPGAARVAAIERSGTAFLPDAQTVIHEADVVTLMGEADTFEKARRQFDTETGRRRRVILMGGTSQSVWLCRALRHRNLSIRLFEAHPERAEELAQKLPWVTVLAAEGTDEDNLREERVDQADAFVAMKDEDEVNILAAARAKTLGARTVIAVLQRPTYLHLLENVGIDYSFSPRGTAVAEIRRRLHTGTVRSLAHLSEGIAEVFEVRVTTAAGKAVGSSLREISLPARSLVAAVQRRHDVFVPNAETRIEVNDTLIVISPSESRKELRTLFGG